MFCTFKQEDGQDTSFLCSNISPRIIYEFQANRNCLIIGNLLFVCILVLIMFHFTPHEQNVSLTLVSL